MGWRGSPILAGEVISLRIQFTPGENKVALVTGGSSGIGLATARLLAQRGMHVWLTARREDVLAKALVEVQAAQKSSNQRCGIVPADLSDWVQAQAVVARVQAEVGLPDLVVNSAGVAHPGYVQELPLEIFRQMMEINYFGTLHTIKALLPGMLERRSGYIVNLSSVAGHIGVFGYTAYGASKYAVTGLSDALRAEMKPHGIGVSVVFPPDTDTPQLAFEATIKPMETKAVSGSMKALSAEAVAQDIISGVERGRYRILPGLDNKILFALSGLLWGTIYPYMDMVVANAQRKKKKEK